MKHRIVSAIFALLGFLWIVFVPIDLLIHTMGDCGADEMCVKLRQANSGLVLWRGLAVGLLLGIAYATYRYFSEEEDV